jgi:hypothetical protein
MAPKKPSPTDMVPAVLSDGEYVIAQPEVEQLPVDVPGWYRNATAGDVILIDPPAVTLAPDEVAWRDRAPSHYGLVPADEPAPTPEPPTDEPTTTADPAPLVKE